MQPRYSDVLIRIFEEVDGSFPVELTYDHEREFPRGNLSKEHLPWVDGPEPEEDGIKLHRWLFADKKLQEAWAEMRGLSSARRIRLRIDAEAAELHQVPWELLRDPKDQPPTFLAATSSTPFSRYLAVKAGHGSAVLKRPLRILVAIASPEDLESTYSLPPIDVADEKRLIEEATAGQEVELTFLPRPCSLDAIETALRQGGHHVLHFVGHGNYLAGGPDEPGQSMLLLEKQVAESADAPEYEAVPVFGRSAEGEAGIAETFAGLLKDSDQNRQDQLRLVVLVSCKSARVDSQEAFRSLAPGLIQAGVPAVLAMREDVQFDAAQTFISTFYRQLLEHGLVDLASNEARSQLRARDLPGGGAPVLLSRLREGALLGLRGRVTLEEQSFWGHVVPATNEHTILPFLGPRVTGGLLDDRAQVARRLAGNPDNAYPFENTSDLAAVSQFLSLGARKTLHRDYFSVLLRSMLRHLEIRKTPAEKKSLDEKGLRAAIDAVDWSARAREQHEDEIHHLLAELKLPIYITTNHDSFLYHALRARPGREPRQEGPRWEAALRSRLSANTDATTPAKAERQYVLDPAPSSDRPVVFHLNGFDDGGLQEDHLVLTEDDYLSQLVCMSRDQNDVLPSDIIEALGSCTYLFMGYDLDDWELRVLLNGLLEPLARDQQPRSVGVQLEPDNAANSEKAVSYLRDYLLERHKIDVYWGTPRQFVTELIERSDAYDADWRG